MLSEGITETFSGLEIVFSDSEDPRNIPEFCPPPILSTQDGKWLLSQVNCGPVFLRSPSLPDLVFHLHRTHDPSSLYQLEEASG